MAIPRVAAVPVLDDHPVSPACGHPGDDDRAGAHTSDGVVAGADEVDASVLPGRPAPRLAELDRDALAGDRHQVSVRRVEGALLTAAECRGHRGSCRTALAEQPFPLLRAEVRLAVEIGRVAHQGLDGANVARIVEGVVRT